MPTYGLKHIYAAKYVNTAGTITYTDKVHVGDAISAKIEPQNAQASLYAEDGLAEFMSAMTGGTISLGVKYIKDAAQKLLFGMKEKSRSVSYVPTGSSATATATATSLVIGSHDDGVYVGIAFYAPNMKDGAKTFTCVFLRKCLFGPPSMTFQTKGENITFQTPTTTGRYLMDDSSENNFYESVVVNDENEAKAWVEAVLA